MVKAHKKKLTLTKDFRGSLLTNKVKINVQDFISQFNLDADAQGKIRPGKGAHR